jgi:hypothetical protein
MSGPDKLEVNFNALNQSPCWCRMPSSIAKSIDSPAMSLWCVCVHTHFRDCDVWADAVICTQQVAEDFTVQLLLQLSDLSFNGWMEQSTNNAFSHAASFKLLKKRL